VPFYRICDVTLLNFNLHFGYLRVRRVIALLYSCGRATNKLCVSEGGKETNPVAADVFDLYFTYREIISE
jgi:hypothetical protein